MATFEISKKITKMYKAKIIFGSTAVREFRESGLIPSVEWLRKNGGTVMERRFDTYGEYMAYKQALKDRGGWIDWSCLPPKAIDEYCPFCGKWREFFVGKPGTVFCPDCGKEILGHHPEP